MTKDRVSAICRALDEKVEAFRNRPLEADYPYLWLDAKVRHEALLIRVGCNDPPQTVAAVVEAEGSPIPESRGTAGAALTTTRRAGTVGRRGRGKQGG